ncbi:hypothetical protein EJ357_32560 [Streptomyces cyaneochromogenes]|uniref:Uncharacterized protein n=1 Tax=Streptomyces cyaneochromogenes TaxID=2496836 RepID=A0A3S9MEL8_9ACTN|nr:hypothetical protein [Streptomyces cyaneochromogenes]AZQ37605.1 hypothetical protein EJ357_32560 [Streptomyces cyaneochromogenes]
MNSSPSQSAFTAAWILVAVLLSLVVALIAVILKVAQGEGLTTALPSAAVAFAGTMALCLPTLTAAGLLQ